MREQKDRLELIVAIQELSNQLNHVLKEENVSSPMAGVGYTDEMISLEEATKNVLVNLSCDMYWEYDPELNRIKFTKPFHNGVEENQTSELSFDKFLTSVSDIHKKIIVDCFHNLIQRNSEIEEFEYQFLQKDGVRDWYHAKSSIIFDHQDKVIKIIGINQNITKNKAEREKIEQAQAKNQMLISFANNFIWEYDCEEDCFTANNSLCDKLGFEYRKYSYEGIAKLFHEDTPLTLRNIIGKEIISGHSRIQMYSARDRGYLICNVNYGGLRNSDGDVYRFIGTIDDITERELLMVTAARDPLTNVYNRRMGGLRLKSSFQKYREQGEFYTIAFFDVDNFKYVNDKFGHDMGDYVLKAICDTISKEIRSSDMLFRWGGDELLLICSGIMKENIYANIDRIRTIIENEKYEYSGEKLNLTVSIGAAYFYKNDDDEQQAVKRADRSLYKAKLAGRNKVCILL